jgi:HAD superfamily hydrolase (TIGR01509 family)
MKEVSIVPSHHHEIKGVIFDLDGTLIDTLGTYTEAFNKGTEVFGLEPVTDEKIADFLNRGLRLNEMLLELFPSVFEGDVKRQTCEEEIRKTYFAMQTGKVLLKPGAKRTLQSLKERGIKVGIFTGRRSTGERRWLELRRLNIDQFVDTMVTAADAPSKPAPDGLIKCIDELGLSAKEVVFVGDSTLDVIAGKKAGVRTVAVYDGVAAKEVLAEQRPDCLLGDLNMLFSYLKGLEKTGEREDGSP